MLYVLEEIFKTKRAQNSEQLNLRVQRSLSWLKKAISMDDDLDLQFVSLSVAFNAIYTGNELSTNDASAQNTVFLEYLYKLDDEQRISQVIWGKARQSIELLLAYPYASKEYWDYKNHKISKVQWMQKNIADKQFISHILNVKDSKQVLTLLFLRLFALKQQMLDGGSNYNSMANRLHMRESCVILQALIPTFIYIIIDNAQTIEFTMPFYPAVQMS